MSDFHPPLPEGATWALDIILRNLEQDPDYLFDSPYTDEEIDVLQRFAGRVDEIEEDEAPVEGKWARLEKESDHLFKSLTEFSKTLNERDHTERMAYFRTATSLLEKIVGIQERAANLKQINLFHDTVLTIMEDVLDAGQRTAVLERLKKSINPEG